MTVGYIILAVVAGGIAGLIGSIATTYLLRRLFGDK